jgi:hypothetical protein
VESQYLEGPVKLNSILILDVDCWVVTYLRNILAHGSTHITTKQGNKTLPTEIWLDILDLAELYVDENTYKPVYGIEMNPRSTNNSGTGSALVCNVLEERKKCGELEGGNRVNAYDKCLQDPSYKLDPENDDIDEDEEYYFRVSKLANNNAISIPISHLAFETKFLFCKVTVQDMISRLERATCAAAIELATLECHGHFKRSSCSATVWMIISVMSASVLSNALFALETSLQN